MDDKQLSAITLQFLDRVNLTGTQEAAALLSVVKWLKDFQKESDPDDAD